jgi:WD40 repeat protein
MGDATGPVGPAPTPLPDVPGYEILAELGHGGMGVVYQPRQTSAGRVVALKMIRAGQLASAAEVQRFHAEAEDMALLDHPHIVPVYEVGEHRGQHYFSMKLIEGGSLAEHLERFAADPRAGAALLIQVARTVQYAHEHGILHRDLKPSNILLDADDQPHVADFGLAKRLEGPQGTPSGAVLGTPAYMAPEQAAGQSKRVTTAVDVYALGAVLYEMLAGRPPFRAETPLETLLQVLHDEPIPPSRLRPKVPADLQTICLKCLHKEPGKRYAGAAELADDLGRFLAGEPIQARPVGPGERLVKWVRRQPAAAALVALGLALVVGMLAAGWWYADQEHHHALKEADLRTEAEANAELYRQERNAARNAEAIATKQRDAARLNLYVSRINQAQREWEANHVGRVVDLLEACRPKGDEKDLRGFEWHYLWNLCHGDRLTFKGHTDTVHCVAWSPDGRYLASVSKHRTVRIWEAASGKQVHVFEEPTRVDFGKVVFSRGGRLLASATADLGALSVVRIWEVATGREVGTLQGHLRVVSALAFSPDDRQLVTACCELYGSGRPVKAQIQFWDAATARLARTVPISSASLGYDYHAVFSPDGRQLVWNSFDPNDPKTRSWKPSVWEVASGQLLLTCKTYATGMTFTPDSQRLVTFGEDGTVAEWDVSAGRQGEVAAPLVTLKHPVPVLPHRYLVFSPNGKRLASADGDGAVQVRDAATGATLYSLKGHKAAVFSVAFSPDGWQLATASQDGTVKVWDADMTREIPGRLGQQDDLAGPQLSLQGPDGKPFRAVTFSPDGRWLAGTSATVLVWEAATGRRVLSLPCRSAATGAKFSPDSRLLAIPSDGGVIVREASTGKQILVIRGEDEPRVRSVAFSPDGRRLVTVGERRKAQLWDISQGKGEVTVPLLVFKAYQNVAFSPDGRLVASSSPNKPVMNLWDVSQGQGELTRPLLTLNTFAYSGVAFSPDGRLRASSNSPTGTVDIWDIATGRGEISAPLLSLFGHTGRVASVAFSPDGSRLASASIDRTVKVWETATGQELLSLKVTGPVEGVSWSPDGQRLAGASADGTVKVWEATPPTPEVRLQREVIHLFEAWFGPRKR